MSGPAAATKTKVKKIIVEINEVHYAAPEPDMTGSQLKSLASAQGLRMHPELLSHASDRALLRHRVRPQLHRPSGWHLTQLVGVLPWVLP